MRLVRSFRIGTKLTLMVLAMMAITLSMLHVTYDYYAAVLVDAVQDQTEALSKALEISVQQLTARGETDREVLKDYVRRLSAKGVTEISILSRERTVVASSNQERVGTTLGAKAPPRRARASRLVVTGTLGEPQVDRQKISYDLDVPIVVDSRVRGYVRLHMILDDFTALLAQIHLKRTLATSVVFLVGLAGCLALAYRMTAPLNQLGRAAARVAEGDLRVTVPTGRRDEIGQLQRHFNAMVERLRENREVEQALQRAERAAVVGRLASAVAHEVRNPLNYINLGVDHLRAAYQPDEAARAREFDQSVRQIKDELRRLNALVSDFLSFGRPPQLTFEPCRIEDVIEEVARLVSPSAVHQGVALDARVARDLFPVVADREGVRTCVLNLATNALQAMPRGGRLTLAVEREEPGGVRITVADTGRGIPAADLERIFEPYFSTRESGTGLGLAITRRIVADHGGRIEVASRPGEGSAFRVWLPVAGPAGAPGPVAAGAFA